MSSPASIAWRGRLPTFRTSYARSKPEARPLGATEQPIDTSAAAGKCFLDMLGVFAEFETNPGTPPYFEATRGKPRTGWSPGNGWPQPAPRRRHATRLGMFPAIALCAAGGDGLERRSDKKASSVERGPSPGLGISPRLSYPRGDGQDHQAGTRSAAAAALADHHFSQARARARCGRGVNCGGGNRRSGQAISN